ncbi:hypothetical protein OF83DRAFT_940673 [Amylostereum chailletii]|nr:hypothetical protein OF83DRAFT_940673 [Amylostereum chailletii]
MLVRRGGRPVPPVRHKKQWSSPPSVCSRFVAHLDISEKRVRPALPDESKKAIQSTDPENRRDRNSDAPTASTRASTVRAIPRGSARSERTCPPTFPEQIFASGAVSSQPPRPAHRIAVAAHAQRGTPQSPLLSCCGESPRRRRHATLARTNGKRPPLRGRRARGGSFSVPASSSSGEGTRCRRPAVRRMPESRRYERGVRFARVARRDSYAIALVSLARSGERA